jgi:non-ribosomal peptide synthetase component F
LIEWMRRVPQATFTNLYGPTEATIASSRYTVPDVPGDGSQPIPIGRACQGEELVVLAESGDELAPGEVGELHIGGAGLSPGYWRDEEKTRAAFIADPRPGRSAERLYRTGDLACSDEDGLFYFLGRTDSQIKSRGYRIELDLLHLCPDRFCGGDGAEPSPGGSHLAAGLHAPRALEIDAPAAEERQRQD